MKHVFIINPVSGKGLAVKFQEKIEKYFKNKNDKYEIVLTNRSGHATEIVKYFTAQEKCRIYSIGGDGTLNEVLNGIVNTDSSIGVIPAGSGNDFIRTIVEGNNFENILEQTIMGVEQEIDLAKINDRYFLNISSAGFDAMVTLNAKKYKKNKYITGSFAYLLSVIITIFNFKTINMDIDIDGEKIKEDILLLAVANGKYYGGGIKIAPFADISDNLLDIYVIRKMKFNTILKKLPLVLKGQHTYAIKEILYFRGKKIIAKSDSDFMINIDGEIIKDKCIEFQIMPKAIKMIFPINTDKL